MGEGHARFRQSPVDEISVGQMRAETSGQSCLDVILGDAGA
jgi:hypothetical protein